MNLFDTGYAYVRNTYLIPRLPYGVERSKYEYWSFKDIITNKIISLKKLSGKSIEIEIASSDYYKAISCDIELFYNKANIQYADFINVGNVSKSWTFVTFYYFSFFVATCIFRVFNRGYIFLDQRLTKRFEDYALVVNSDIISLDSGNYFFSLKRINRYENAEIVITKKGDSLHKLTWIQLESLLQEIENNSSGDEKLLIATLRDTFRYLNIEFPSHLRNKLNYNGEASIQEFENYIDLIAFLDLDRKSINEILKMDITTVSDSTALRATALLSSYTWSLLKLIFKDYNERTSSGKKFDVERKKYLKSKNCLHY